jgi:hypothetical protein
MRLALLVCAAFLVSLELGDIHRSLDKIAAELVEIHKTAANTASTPCRLNSVVIDTITEDSIKVLLRSVK